jgi:transcriptional regulator with XRE-family HTH domain
MRKKNFLVMSSIELRAAREEMGLTQQEAADKYELSLEGYKKYELGLRPIPGPVKLLTQIFLERQRKS